MKFFDLHCDTIGECSNKNIPLRINELHIDLLRGKEIGEYTQVFAIWIPDEFRGNRAVAYFNKVKDYFYKEIGNNKDLISLYKDKTDTPIKAILSVEGGSACGGTIAGLHHLYECGVSLITLTWNSNNEIGAGAFSDGGLTSFGKEFVKEAENLGITLDASHLNRQCFFELAEIAEKPFIASHSNADIVNNKYAVKRNLTEEQIMIIKERKGIIGLNFCLEFIEDENASGIDSLYRQIEYFLSLGCENIISFGSDFDGCKMHNDFKGIHKIKEVYNKLINKGISEDVLNKLFYENAERFFI